MMVNELKQNLSFGNRKLPKDTAIFNICSATDCPSKRLGLCRLEDMCYAMKAERMYPGVLPYRRRQEKFWDKTHAELFVYLLLHINSFKKNKIKLLRVNESGDFRSQDDVDKLSQIADSLLLAGADIGVYAYTARKDLDFSNKSPNLNIVGTYFMVDSMFKPVRKIPDVLSDKKSKVCIADCTQCSLCSYGQKNIIYAKIH